ncbi:hypothetical protein RUM44_003040 [Polyplax serrata]|uniref:U2A'/phosphoprotein 32 family A C-terminal domain-containing protein n=1 Tax=Polyplax serrata TaxID=468196 RepID=A0ABR1AXE0_POLSC
MVKITQELLRKRSEHNECEIGTLEELSLHQEDIEKIEYLQNWCRHLEILLLQSNLISKIENLGKLKKLRYLNLALNNIERIENLERLESLEKLDLTLNFVGELTSVRNLKDNYNLKNLYLTGNPCTDFKGYREYVITVLPQLEQLDGVGITRSERITANQDFNDYSKSIVGDQNAYRKKRENTKPKITELTSSDEESELEMTEQELKAFWDAPSQNTPEDRIAIAKKSRKLRDIDRNRSEKKAKPKPIKLFTSDGRPLNINQSRIPFKLTDDDESGCKVLDVSVYRYLDTTLIDVDLHPRYVTINIKGKVLQITFDEDIAVDASTCQRSQTTGHLVVTLQKANACLKPKPPRKREKPSIPPPKYSVQSKREYLEIGPVDRDMDFSKIVENNTRKKYEAKPTRKIVPEKKPSPDFVDNDEVPPLV